MSSFPSGERFIASPRRRRSGSYGPRHCRALGVAAPSGGGGGGRALGRGARVRLRRKRVLASSIRRLLAGEPVAPFIDEHYQRLPYSPAGAATAPLRARLSGKFWGSTVSAPAADTLVVRRNHRHEGPVPTTAVEAQGSWPRGYTPWCDTPSGITRGWPTWPPVSRPTLPRAVNIHMYCTPAERIRLFLALRRRGGVHRADRRPQGILAPQETVNPWPLEETLPADMHYEREIMPLDEVRARGRRLALHSQRLLAHGGGPRNGHLAGHWRRAAIRSRHLRPAAARGAAFATLEAEAARPGRGATLSEDELKNALSEIISRLTNDLAAIAQASHGVY